MAEMYNTSQLRDLNEEAYRTNPNAPILNGQKISPLYKDKIFITPNTKTKYYVVDTRYDDSSGFKGLAVAPVINGKPNYSATAVIAAGTDSHLESGLPDIANAAEEMLTGTSGQEPVAESFVHSVQKEVESKGGSVSQLSGYSQGGYMLQVGADTGIPATVFNGFFDYSSLSDQEKQYIENHSNQFVNYKNKNDPVVNYLNDDFQHGLIGDREYVGTIVWVDGPEGIAGHV